MGDLLEKYIVDHRSEFDDLEPSAALWGKIGEDLQPEKSRYDWGLLWKVAAIVFLASTVYLAWDRQFADIPETTAFQSEFFEAERFYVSQILQMKSELHQLNIEEKNADLIQEEEELSEIYKRLKQDYLSRHTNEAVKDALVENLRLRIKILDNQIKILKEINSTDYDSEHTEI
ncbi:MAG: hypothetical protein ABJN36_15465 [Cyclobacteriaceae bacterium]